MTFLNPIWSPALRAGILATVLAATAAAKVEASMDGSPCTSWTGSSRRCPRSLAEFLSYRPAGEPEGTVGDAGVERKAEAGERRGMKRAGDGGGVSLARH